jgi:hypothetical protein
MAVSANISFLARIRETLETGVDGAASPVIIHDALDKSVTLNASSAVPATKCSVDTIALTAGAKTVDLTALAGANGTVDGTGLKVQFIRIVNNGANAMTFAEGASNGYELLGNGWTITLPAGGYMQFYLPEGTPDIASGAKTIDVSGTGTQTFDLTVVMG